MPPKKKKPVYKGKLSAGEPGTVYKGKLSATARSRATAGHRGQQRAEDSQSRSVQMPPARQATPRKVKRLVMPRSLAQEKEATLRKVTRSLAQERQATPRKVKEASSFLSQQSIKKIMEHLQKLQR